MWEHVESDNIALLAEALEGERVMALMAVDNEQSANGIV